MEKQEQEKDYLGIKDWAADDRPREKLIAKGRRSLSDAELVAILIGSGTTKESAVDVAKKILRLADNDLRKLGKLSLAEFTSVKGIGQAKAISIAAAMELARRRKETPVQKVARIMDSNCAYQEIKPLLSDLPHEECWALLLNRGNEVMKHLKIATGGFSGTVVDLKFLLSEALQSRAHGVILTHNHPSGSTNPSSQDLELTQQIKEACKLVGLQLLDHIIFTETAYFSFADEGAM